MVSDSETRAISWMRPLLDTLNPSRFTPSPLEVSTSVEKSDSLKASGGPRLSQGCKYSAHVLSNIFVCFEYSYVLNILVLNIHQCWT